jgi:hypothetical protein
MRCQRRLNPGSSGHWSAPAANRVVVHLPPKRPASGCGSDRQSWKQPRALPTKIGNRSTAAAQVVATARRLGSAHQPPTQSRWREGNAMTDEDMFTTATAGLKEVSRPCVVRLRDGDRLDLGIGPVRKSLSTMSFTEEVLVVALSTGQPSWLRSGVPATRFALASVRPPSVLWRPPFLRPSVAAPG